jgi:hypothetical protein
MSEFKLFRLQYTTPVKGDDKKLFLYDDDGFHYAAIWFRNSPTAYPHEVLTADAAFTMAQEHWRTGREVRVTDGGDMLLFHVVGGRVLYPQNCNLEEFWGTL